ncbi:MAG: SoxR reducing system RseC family protein [Calditrichaceae bacterium]|nr:SoxR reducing system RseC family protein [Calditrichaceae bacterium]MBN2709636.1 SoxR reducing system RseC family protein [Calditrichaceae bacterium]RQV92431.1 MAG: hypothetical protein EH224_15645 [Calditrichota bacterium]
MISDKSIKGRIQGITETSFTVSLDSIKSCSACGFKAICSEKKIEFERDNADFPLKIGQMVEVEYKKVIQTSFIVYAVPMLFFFAGIAGTILLVENAGDLMQFTGAVIGVIIGLGVVWLLNRKLSDRNYKVNIKPINL